VIGEPVLFANLGAEEEGAWRRMAGHPRVRSVARLWAALFPAGARMLGATPEAAPRLAGALASGETDPAFPFCAAAHALVPWLATAEAEALARAEGLPLAATPPDVTRRVHDKAFAHAAALTAGLVPGALAGTTLVLSPDELDDADAVRCRIEAAVANWPAALRARFALKPRLGTSGRGRLIGREGALDVARLQGALERLRASGGVIVEPWLERTRDLSAQLHVAGADDVRVLGTLRQILTPHGAPLGHAGRISGDGAVDSDTAWDAELRAAARAVGLAAARAGFRGVCGLDALVFRDRNGAEVLRPVVELNARFTMGTVALGHVGRALRAELGIGARAFYFGFGTPEGEGSAILSDDPSARLWFAADWRALPVPTLVEERSA